MKAPTTAISSCASVHGPNALPGWLCCSCRTYNSVMRDWCRNCGHRTCLPASIQQGLVDEFTAAVMTGGAQ